VFRPNIFVTLSFVVAGGGGGGVAGGAFFFVLSLSIPS